MKQLFKLALIVVATLCSTQAFGQKFGYINSQELISVMPELDSVQIKLNQVQQDFATQLEVIQVEFNNKYQEYQKNQATYSAAINQMKQQELSDLQKRFEEYQQMANTEIQKTQAELMQPVLEKANNAVKNVGQANGFTVIFDQATNPVVYIDEASVVNVLPLVKTALGIKDEPAAK